MADELAPHTGHETRDISVRVVMWFAIGLLAGAVVIHLAIAGLYKGFEKRYPSPDAPSRIALDPHMIAPAPQLQTAPMADLRNFKAGERAKLNSYGWVDKPAGVIGIPIDHAIDLIAQRGLPTRGGGMPDASDKTAVQLQQDKAAATKP